LVTTTILPRGFQLAVAVLSLLNGTVWFEQQLVNGVPAAKVAVWVENSSGELMLTIDRAKSWSTDSYPVTCKNCPDFSASEHLDYAGSGVLLTVQLKPDPSNPSGPK
jgi:hypothetical protein